VLVSAQVLALASAPVSASVSASGRALAPASVSVSAQVLALGSVSVSVPAQALALGLQSALASRSERPRRSVRTQAPPCAGSPQRRRCRPRRPAARAIDPRQGLRCPPESPSAAQSALRLARRSRVSSKAELRVHQLDRPNPSQCSGCPPVRDCRQLSPQGSRLVRVHPYE
jgi:hypothetical protein